MCIVHCTSQMKPRFSQHVNVQLRTACRRFLAPTLFSSCPPAPGEPYLRSTVRICRAGLHLSLRMSRQMRPSLSMLGW